MSTFCSDIIFKGILILVILQTVIQNFQSIHKLTLQLIYQFVAWSKSHCLVVYIQHLLPSLKLFYFHPPLLHITVSAIARTVSFSSNSLHVHMAGNLGEDRSVRMLSMKLIIPCAKMMSSSLYCQVAVQVSSCFAKGTNWSVFDR